MSSDTFPCNPTPQTTFGRQNDGSILWQRISVCSWTFLLEWKMLMLVTLGLNGVGTPHWLRWKRIVVESILGRISTHPQSNPSRQTIWSLYLKPPWKWTIPLVRPPCIISSRSMFRASFPCWESVIRGPCPCLCPKNDIASSNSKPNLKATKRKSRWANIYTCSLVPWYKLSHPNFVCWP